MKLLVVEDDDSTARFLKQALTEAGYQVELATRGDDALRRILVLGKELSLVLLDLMLAGMSGLEVCRKLRASGLSTPVLMVTAKDTVRDKIEGLESGADDYIVKPYLIGELIARVRALLRRSQAWEATPLLRAGGLTLDPRTRKATRYDTSVQLSSTEYSLLELLMRHQGRVVTRTMVMDHVWSYEFDGTDNVIDVYIGYLRKKLERETLPKLIHTVRGVGYRLDASSDGSKGA